jgi:hypothetical protein
VRGVLPVSQHDLRWSREGWEIMKEVLVSVTPDVQKVDVATAYSFELLDKLQAAGLNDALGIPKTTA